MQARGRGSSLTIFSVSVIVDALDRVLTLDGAFRGSLKLGRLKLVVLISIQVRRYLPEVASRNTSIYTPELHVKYWDRSA